MIKGLTVYAPYATAIAGGVKTVEHRNWPTSYRGDLLICSAARCDDGWQGLLPIGHALAVVRLSDVQVNNDDGFDWILTDVRPIVPVPVEGRQRLFNVDHVALDFIDVYGDDLLPYWLELGLIDRIVD